MLGAAVQTDVKYLDRTDVKYLKRLHFYSREADESGYLMDTLEKVSVERAVADQRRDAFQNGRSPSLLSQSHLLSLITATI
jgi:hypothetical protein